jgi:hypothetical protein
METDSGLWPGGPPGERTATTPGSEAFPLPDLHRGTGEARRTEEEEAGEEVAVMQGLLARMTPAVRAQITRLLTNYTQPPEWPFASAEARMAVDANDMPWASYVGAVVTANQGEEGGEGRRGNFRDSDPYHSTRTYQRTSNRPEQLFRTQLPRVSLNTVLRFLVSGTARVFNPLQFVLLPEGLRAIEGRDAWLRAPLPFYRGRVVPLAQTSQLDLERCEYQQIFMDSCNRVLGSLDGVWNGDPDAAVPHLLDTLFVLAHYASHGHPAEEKEGDVDGSRRVFDR